MIVRLIRSLANQSRSMKIGLQIAYDAVAVAVSLYLPIMLDRRLVNFDFSLKFFALVAFFSISVMYLVGVYKIFVRFSGVRFLQWVLGSQLIVVVALVGYSDSVGKPLGAAYLLLYFLLSVFIICFGRVFAKELLYLANISKQNKMLIWGAGQAGTQLLTAMMQSQSGHIVGFVDEDIGKIGAQIHGVNIYSPERLEYLIEKYQVSEVVLALPSVGHLEKSVIISKLEQYAVEVKTMPPMEDILNGVASVDQLEDIEIEDLLGRDLVPAVPELLQANITNKIVVVTGAGGSIGSELCRQIAKLKPKKLILVEMSEFALYSIDAELASNNEVCFESHLVSITDKKRIGEILKSNLVDTVYHAAAYKHVPLVEANPFSAINNNIFGTKILLEAALDVGVKSFTLISTDKAVRPTNIMGATKRMAEILCQSASQTSKSTKVSMVRFGNVLGSSGSVVPRFRQQIKSGEPVTVTHPEINRFFMMIPEAVQLVIQSSSMAKGGDVFLLDMGQPVKIKDLAEKLIRLSGKIPVYDQKSNSKQVLITFSGLRPGEKLYEELLIDGNSTKTDHPKINSSKEEFPEENIIIRSLKKLEVAIENNDLNLVIRVFEECKVGYHVPTKSVNSDVAIEVADQELPIHACGTGTVGV